MTNEEAKAAFFSRLPVKANDITYKRISAIIYRLDDNNKTIISAELLDKTERSVTIARLQDIQEVGK